MTRKPSKQEQRAIWAEMARRKVQFHNTESWENIRLWGLFRWGTVSRLIEQGLLITDMSKENVTVWVRPSEQAYNNYIEPLLNQPLAELLKLSGWE